MNDYKVVYARIEKAWCVMDDKGTWLCDCVDKEMAERIAYALHLKDELDERGRDE